MLATPVVADPFPRDDENPEWERILRHWYNESAIMLALAAAVFTYGNIYPYRSPAAVAIELLSVAIIATAYLGVGTKALRYRDERLGLQYLAIAIPAVGLAMTQGENGIFLAVPVMADNWVMLTRRRLQVIFTVIWAIIVFLGTFAGSGYDIRLWENVIWRLMLIYALSAGVGLWVARVSRWQRRDAWLIGELRKAQAEIAAAHHEAGVAAERERLAGEIHDTLAQGFTSVITLSQAANAHLERGKTEKAGKALAVVEQVARENLAEARSLIAASKPAPLQDNSISQALHRVGERWAAETGVPIKVATNITSLPSHEQEVIILRIAQESLANVRKHANANWVEVTLDLHDDAERGESVRLVVTDDGVGIPLDSEMGYGYLGMIDRLKTVGGGLEVSRISDEGGTEVKVLLPVDIAAQLAAESNNKPLILTYGDRKTA